MYDKNICTRETTFTGGCPEPSGNTSSRRPLGDGQFHPRRLRRRGAGTPRRSASVSVGLRRLVTTFQRVIPTFSHLDVRMRTSATRSIEAGCIRCVLRSCLHASGAGWSNEMNRHRSGMAAVHDQGIPGLRVHDQVRRTIDFLNQMRLCSDTAKTIVVLLRWMVPSRAVHSFLLGTSEPENTA